jgi:hypothetical protein
MFLKDLTGCGLHGRQSGDPAGQRNDVSCDFVAPSIQATQRASLVE